MNSNNEWIWAKVATSPVGELYDPSNYHNVIVSQNRGTMLLKEMKEAIDGGKTAKLVIISVYGVEVTVRIKKLDEYIWQRAEITHPMVQERPNTKAWPTWEMLLEGIEGMQTETDQWIECDDELDPALPTRLLSWLPSSQQL